MSVSLLDSVAATQKSFGTTFADVLGPASRGISWSTTTIPGGATVQAGGITPDASVEERSDDESVITENPVENGSVSNDHAYDLPQQLELTYAWAPGSQQGKGQVSFINDMYQKLLMLKQAKILLTVSTGRRLYQSMLIKGLSVTTDKETENILMIRIMLQQLLLTKTQTVSIPTAAQMTQPEKTMPTINGGAVSLQPAPNFNSANLGGK